MHDDARRMYELEYPVPAVKDESPEGSGPTLIVAMHGYADAGLAVEASADHLKAALESRQVVSFNNDELIDYRSRRPAVTLDNERVIDVEPAELGIKVLRDNSGKSFLLLSGPEPDLRWEAFSDAVVNLVEKFDVSNTICLYAAPMPVPHTRPLVVSAHGNNPELVQHMFKLDSKMMVPGSASLSIEKALDEKGRNVAGYTAHVPHYLASSPFPHATYRLLDSVVNSAHLNVPLGALEGDIERVNQQLEEQVLDSDSVTQVVHQLEEQYDEFMERYRNENPQAIMPGEESLPTGEELSAEFQQFLADLDDPDEHPGDLGDDQ
ncbi:ATP-grasp superfamily enzyme [Corynebacterium camporealensis]|uniref:ATP-grasp superfamily enzyme n=1 Tax=Corynebacterium camporealensis TaxID=161896 RepID=A0A0F6TBC9_9CORY|nr:PAC2 family protein [Corynebacterium camporealensis]AKE39334.1 ATP-grasp superfamily enzyme [Corynebacterium camporealensis]AVH88510.1 ATP-grasp superfamily enzyme [Corynebacterium camporealensis]MDY5839728.1 PAC2 family protein [Corynebacterium camporealensis]